MPGFLKKRFSDRNPDENWQQTLRRLRKNLVPLSGEAETLQGELVRCVDNLNDEAMRNGWMNWDAGDEEGDRDFTALSAGRRRFFRRGEPTNPGGAG